MVWAGSFGVWTAPWSCCPETKARLLYLSWGRYMFPILPLLWACEYWSPKMPTSSSPEPAGCYLPGKKDFALRVLRQRGWSGLAEKAGVVTRVLVRESRRVGVSSRRGGNGGKRLEWCKEGAMSQGVPCGSLMLPRPGKRSFPKPPEGPQHC